MTSNDHKASLTYLVGDATHPQGPGQKIIAHVCNDTGGWGKGFVLALSSRWDTPEASYRKWHKSGSLFTLGMCQLVRVEPDLCVANMVAQHGYVSDTNPVALRYDALETCLSKTASRIQSRNVTVHMPRIGAGLAGGSWPQIERIITKTLVQAGVDCFVYDLA